MSTLATVPVKGRSLPAAVSAIAVVLGCVPFYVSVVPPMADLPSHVLVARVITEYGDPVLRYSNHFDIDWAVAPTALFYVVLVLLQKLAGPFGDARLYLTLWVVLTWLSVWWLARVQDKSAPWIAGIAALPLSFCWYAYNGFLPFLMSIPLFAFSVGVWLCDWRPSVKAAALWVLAPVTFGFHIVGAAATGAVVGLTALVQALHRRDWRPLFWAPASLLPVLLMTGLYLSGQNAPTARISYFDVVRQGVDVVKFTCMTLSDVASLIMVLWLGAMGLVAVLRWRDLARAPYLAIGAVCLLGLSIGLPQGLGALWPAGPRLFPFSLVLLIAGLPWHALPRRATVSVCVLLLTALSLSTARHARSLDPGFREAISAATTMEPGRRVLPVVDLSMGSRSTAPFLHVADLQNVLRGGSNPYALAAPNVLTGASPLRFRRPEQAREYAFIYDKSRTAEDYVGVAESYDYVLLWGRFPAIDSVVRREMRVVYEHGPATLFARRHTP